MNLISRLRRKKVSLSDRCLHAALIPKWDTMCDMVQVNRVSRYTCADCGETLTAEEGNAHLQKSRKNAR